MFLVFETLKLRSFRALGILVFLVISDGMSMGVA
jgi:hypothetical protein